jgi:DNA-binding PadR family transcriptional regulator
MTQDVDPQTFLPLSPAVFHVLVSLGDGDRHGYAIIKDVAERTNGAERMGAGTLYAILRRLLDDELIDEVDGPAEDKRRRYYRLTRLGRRVARGEVERLERTTSLARATGLFGRSRTS